jgi:hypothetical protein
VGLRLALIADAAGYFDFSPPLCVTFDLWYYHSTAGTEFEMWKSKGLGIGRTSRFGITNARGITSVRFIVVLSDLLLNTEGKAIKMVSCVQALLSSKMHYTVAAAAQPAGTLHKSFARALEYEKKFPPLARR